MARSLLAKTFFLLIAIPVFIAIVALSLFNGDDVNFTIIPDYIAFSPPLFVIILLFFAIGFLCGGALSWLDKR